MPTNEAIPDFERLVRQAEATRRGAEEAALEKEREQDRRRDAARHAFSDRMSGSLRDVGEMLARLAGDQVFASSQVSLRGPDYLEEDDGQRERHVWMLGTKLVFSLYEDSTGAHCLSVSGRGRARSVQLRPGSGPEGDRMPVSLDYDGFLRWIAGRDDMFGVITPSCPRLVVWRAADPGESSVELLPDADGDGIRSSGWLVSSGIAFRYHVLRTRAPFLARVIDAGEGLPPLETGDVVVGARHDSPVGREIARRHERAVRDRIAAEAADVGLAEAMTKRFDEVAAAVGDLAAALLSTRSGRLLCGAVPDGIRRVPGRFMAGPTLRKKSETISLGRIEVEMSCVTRVVPADGPEAATGAGGLPIVVQVSFKDDVRPHVCTWHWNDGPLDRRAMVAEILAKAAAFMVADQARDEDVRHGDWDLRPATGHDPAPPPPAPGVR